MCGDSMNARAVTLLGDNCLQLQRVTIRPVSLSYPVLFQVLGDNLLKLIIRSNYRGMDVALVKRITKQVDFYSVTTLNN